MDQQMTCAEAQAIVDEQLARGCTEIVLPAAKILLGQNEDIQIRGDGLTIRMEPGGVFVRVGNETTN